MLTQSTFILDERIATTCIHLGDWPLCQVLLKNTADYPWFILVPRETNIRDIDELSKSNQQQLMTEITKLSTIVKQCFNPDKLNVGALGNIVSQLHIHIIARFKEDKLWPHSVWQNAHMDIPYSEAALATLIPRMHSIIDASFNCINTPH
jgi:diadenosine tetraphosphate (Ap4A) HIT family hydrolase